MQLLPFIVAGNCRLRRMHNTHTSISIKHVRNNPAICNQVEQNEKWMRVVFFFRSKFVIKLNYALLLLQNDWYTCELTAPKAKRLHFAFKRLQNAIYKSYLSFDRLGNAIWAMSRKKNESAASRTLHYGIRNDSMIPLRPIIQLQINSRLILWLWFIHDEFLWRKN